MLLHKIQKIKGFTKIFIWMIFYKNIKFGSMPECIYPTSKIYISKYSHINIGKKLSVRNNVNIYCIDKAKIEIGDNVFFNDNIEISALKSIKIGNNCIFGNSVSIYDNDHDYKKDIRQYKCSNIEIGDNCWIGCNCVILRGSRIGNNCVIGAGTVIKNDIPDNSIVYTKNHLIIKNIENKGDN